MSRLLIAVPLAPVAESHAADRPGCMAADFDKVTFSETNSATISFLVKIWCLTSSWSNVFVDRGKHACNG